MHAECQVAAGQQRKAELNRCSSSALCWSLVCRVCCLEWRLDCGQGEPDRLVARCGPCPTETDQRVHQRSNQCPSLSTPPHTPIPTPAHHWASSRITIPLQFSERSVRGTMQLQKRPCPALQGGRHTPAGDPESLTLLAHSRTRCNSPNHPSTAAACKCRRRAAAVGCCAKGTPA
jgi:hypothetical protein